MSLGELLRERAVLLSLGMVSVFAFLTFLVFAILVMSKVASALGANDVKPSTSSSPKAAVAAPNQSQLLAVISSAVHKYRSQSKS